MGAGHRRHFPAIQKVHARLVKYLKSTSPTDVIDMDKVTCRESLDVIGTLPFPTPAFMRRRLLNRPSFSPTLALSSSFPPSPLPDPPSARSSFRPSVCLSGWMVVFGTAGESCLICHVDTLLCVHVKF